MNEIMLQAILQQVLPILGTVIAGLVAYFLPRLLQKLDLWLSAKLQLSQELLTQEQEAAISREVVKWINFAEEYARKEFKTGNKKIEPANKFYLASDMVVAHTKLNSQESKERVLAELSKLRHTTIAPTIEQSPSRSLNL